MTVTMDSIILIGRLADRAERIFSDGFSSHYERMLLVFERKVDSESKTKAPAFRVRSAARSIRSSVRQTFAARTAAKAGDDGGGDSDPEPRHQHKHQHQHRNTQQNHLNKAVSTILCGGAK